jgi:hypothetical protein
MPWTLAGVPMSVGMVEISWKILAQGLWIQQIFACVFLSFSFLWPMES